MGTNNHSAWEHTGLVESSGTVSEWLAELPGHSVLGLDTEFLRESTYYPEICLIQVSSGVRTMCIDPLSNADLEPLRVCLSGEKCLKVLHAARQDIEVLQLQFGFIPGPIFDTQIAATLCGLGDQRGYAAVVEHVTGVVLDKGATRTRWCRRPLTEEQVRYATEDVAWLPVLYDYFREKLEKNDRLSWMQEEMEGMSDPALYQIDSSVAWKRLRGAQRLPVREQHLAGALAEWRESEAQRRNKPRHWIVDDRTLIDIASSGSGNVEAMLGPKSRRHARSIAAVVNQWAEDGASKEPLWQPRRREPELDQLVKSGLRRIAELARDLDIPASFIATKRDVLAWIQGDDDVPLARGWRRQLVDLPRLVY